MKFVALVLEFLAKVLQGVQVFIAWNIALVRNQKALVQAHDQATLAEKNATKLEKALNDRYRKVLQNTEQEHARVQREIQNCEAKVFQSNQRAAKLWEKTTTTNKQISQEETKLIEARKKLQVVKSQCKVIEAKERPLLQNLNQKTRVLDQTRAELGRICRETEALQVRLARAPEQEANLKQQIAEKQHELEQIGYEKEQAEKDLFQVSLQEQGASRNLHDLERQMTQLLWHSFASEVTNQQNAQQEISKKQGEILNSISVMTAQQQAQHDFFQKQEETVNAITEIAAQQKNHHDVLKKQEKVVTTITEIANQQKTQQEHFKKHSEILTSIGQNVVGLGNTLKRKEPSQQSDCVVCWTKRATEVILPCGHCCLCETCAVEVTSRNGRLRQICPMCNGPATRSQHIYFP